MKQHCQDYITLKLGWRWHWKILILGGYVFATYPFGNKDIWLYKWGEGEETMDLKIFLDSGVAAQSIHRTNDNGFIISTLGCIIIKTDSNLSF
tara:strand:- start:892 stop:1170 length:279 start_codon:yes stop_codon:yes gene_type:complete